MVEFSGERRIKACSLSYWGVLGRRKDRACAVHVDINVERRIACVWGHGDGQKDLACNVVWSV